MGVEGDQGECTRCDQASDRVHRVRYDESCAISPEVLCTEDSWHSEVRGQARFRIEINRLIHLPKRAITERKLEDEAIQLTRMGFSEKYQASQTCTQKWQGL